MSECQEIGCRKAVHTYPCISCVYLIQRHVFLADNSDGRMVSCHGSLEMVKLIVFSCNLVYVSLV
jgi:hypothetical protein